MLASCWQQLRNSRRVSTVPSGHHGHSSTFGWGSSEAPRRRHYYCAACAASKVRAKLGYCNLEGRAQIYWASSSVEQAGLVSKIVVPSLSHEHVVFVTRLF
jgi:hypothetical protein